MSKEMGSPIALNGRGDTADREQNNSALGVHPQVNQGLVPGQSDHVINIRLPGG